MKNHLSQWVEVRKWKLSLDVFLGWDPTKKKAETQDFELCAIYIKQTETITGPRAAAEKMDGREEKKTLEIYGDGAYFLFYTKISAPQPRREPLTLTEWENAAAGATKSAKRLPMASRNNWRTGETCFWLFFPPNFRGIFFGLWPSGPRWEVSTLQIYSNFIF